MNALRFLRKCFTDPPAAVRSVKLVVRSTYGRAYWTILPKSPLRYRLPSGGVLLLEARHSFTHCFWPGVDKYEPDVRAALLHFLKAGDTFLDCGANIGYFSVLAGDLVGARGHVFAIEANPVTFGMLERNLSANRSGVAVHCALMAVPGEVSLFVPRQGGDVYSSTRKGGLVKGEDTETITVPGRTLDDVVGSLGINRVDVLKIDIEGGELDVLRSARHVLRNMRPVVVCEYGTNTWPAFGATVEGLFELLDECDYSVGVFDVQRGCVAVINDEVWKSPYANLVLQPKAQGTVP
jgi:FkbM family methyltransferase